MLTLARIFPLRDGIATLTDTSTSGLAAGLRYSISPTLLDVRTLMSGGIFCGSGGNFATLRGLLAQFLQAWNSANPATPADRVLGVGDELVPTAARAAVTKAARRSTATKPGCVSRMTHKPHPRTPVR